MTRALLGLSLVPVALLTLVPTSLDLGAGCAVEWSVPTLGAVELMANVVLFVPLVLLAGILTARPLVALLGASVLSALIELVQAVVPALGRSCSTNDWLSSTLGAALGVESLMIMEKSGQNRPRKPLFSMINSGRSAELGHTKTGGRIPQRNPTRRAARATA